MTAGYGASPQSRMPTTSTSASLPPCSSRATVMTLLPTLPCGPMNVRLGSRLFSNSGRRSVGATIDSAIADA